jgi:drug/metabolite transporter (DMT)-like permease
MSIVYLLMLLAVTATSIWHVLGKLALTNGMDASVFLVYRLFFSSAILFVSMKLLLRISLIPPLPSMYPRIILVGIATFIHSICFVYGLLLTTPFLCAVMQPSVPVIVWILTVTLGMERFEFRKFFGVILCSIGAVGAAAASAHHSEHSPMGGTDFETGSILIIIQCIFYACHLVFQQPLLQYLPPVQVTATMYLIAGIIGFCVTMLRTLLVEVLPVLGFSADLGRPNWSLSSDPQAWAALAFCVVFASAFTHGVYAWASKKVAPTTVSVFITIEPITTTIVSLLITRSGLPTLVEAAFAGTVALGVVLVLRGGSGGGNHPSTAQYEPVKPREEFELEEGFDYPSAPARRRASNVQ